MKWNLLIASLVLGLGMSTQSFGFELLDRMLGVSGGGDCCQKPTQKGCCQKSACQKDHCQKAPLLGHAGKGCCQKAPCQKDHGKDCCQKAPCQKSHLGGLFSHAGKGCCQKAPVQKDCCQKADSKCGCAQKPLFSLHNGCCQKSACQKDHGKDACQKSHCQKSHCGPSLLDSIFACHKRGCCQKAVSKCGCDKGKGGKGDDKVPAPAEAGEAPMPPAPVVDPSAFLHTQRRVTPASATLVR